MWMEFSGTTAVDDLTGLPPYGGIVSRQRHGEIIAAGDVLHDAFAVGVPAVDPVSEIESW